MRTPVRPAACLLLLLAACDGGRSSGAGGPPGDGPAVDVSGALAPLFTDAAHRGAAIGLGVEEGRPDAAIATVMAARLSESGSHVVVLDVVPPFVKVFDRSGGLRAAFLGRGGGPEEARSPTALATAGDSLILVGDGRRLAVFGFDGRLRGQLSGLPFFPIAATEGCDGDWLLYGPRRETGSRARSGEWVHRVRLGDRPEIRSALPDSIPAGGVPFGLAFGLVRHPGGARLRHELGAAPVAVEWECGADRPIATPLSAGDAVAGSPPAAGGGRAAATGTIAAGDEAQAGIAVLPEGPVHASLVAAGEGGETRTRLRGRRAGGRWTATLPGLYQLRDSRPGVGVLVEVQDPVPHLFVLRESDLSRVLEPGS